MATSVSMQPVNNLILCEETIISNLGKEKLEAIKHAAQQLEEPFINLEKAGIEIYISASENGLAFKIKDQNGNILPDSEYEVDKDRSPYLILGSAITKAFYNLNKRVSYAMEMLKA
ncbi:MAG: hypothetical protein AB1782_00055 [Cyanobacteriota bacterium]